jgi:hypothetical protein
MKSQAICVALAILLPGPTAHAQWVQCDRLYERLSVNVLAVSGANLFAGTGGGGVVRSTNNGVSWTAASVGLPKDSGDPTRVLPINCLTSSGTNLFAGTGSDGVFLSTNDGTNWTAASVGLPKDSGDPTQVLPINCLTSSGTNLFAGTGGGGVVRSTNNGTMWTSVSQGLNNALVWSLAIHGTDLFAGTTWGLFRPTDNGTSWTGSSAGLPKDRWDTTRVLPINCLTSSGTNLFAGTQGGGVYLSTNNGASWSAANKGLPDALTRGDDYYGVHALVVSGETLLAGTPGGVFRSTDNGTNWTPANSGLANAQASVAQLDSYPNEAGGSDLLAGCSAGIFISSDHGATWNDMGLWDISVSCVSVNGIPLFASGLDGRGTTPFNGAWRTNNGMSWENIRYLRFAPPGIVAIGTRVFTPNSGSGVSVSTDNGTTWTKTNATFRGFSQMVEMDSSLFAGAYEGVFRSTDNGMNWAAVNAGIPNVSCFAVLKPILFAGTSGGVFRSTNKGESWTAVNNGLTNTGVRSLVAFGTSLFAGTAGGVFFTTNSGTIWTAVNANLPHAVVNDLFVFGKNLFAAIDSNGVWRRPLSEMITSVEPATEMVPREFNLAQNYPNPFNPSTTIGYGLPERSQVNLAVFNTLGQQVAQLVNGEVEAGYHDVKFDASSLSSGVYFYRMQAGSCVETRKLCLLR